MVNQLIIYLAMLGYFGFLCRFFIEWLNFFLKDEDMKSPENRLIFGSILTIAAILWPIVVPFAYLELLNFHRKNRKVIDLLINQSNSNFSND